MVETIGTDSKDRQGNQGRRKENNTEITNNELKALLLSILEVVKRTADTNEIEKFLKDLIKKL